MIARRARTLKRGGHRLRSHRWPNVLILALISAPILLAAPEQADVSREQVLLQAARNSSKGGEYELAVERYREYLQLRETDGQAVLEVAGVLTRLGRRTQADEICNEAISKLESLQRSNPQNVEALRHLSRLTRWAGRYADAEHWYELYLHLEPRDRQARLERARLAFWDLRYDDARRLYRALSEDFPDAPVFQLECQAKHFNGLGRARKAAGFYEQALAHEPEDVELLFDLGQMYSRMNFSKRAEGRYDRVLELAPDHSMADRAKSAEQWRRRRSITVEQSVVSKKGRGREVDITQYRTDVRFAPQRLGEALEFSVGVGQSFFSFDLRPELDETPQRWQRVFDAVGLGPITSVAAALKRVASIRRLRRFDSHSPATHLTLDVEKKFDTAWHLASTLELTTYGQRPHQTIQFDLAMGKRIEDELDISLIAGLQDVLQNFTTLDDGLSRYYVGGRFDWQPFKLGGLSGRVRGLWYDDNNKALDYQLQAYYMLSRYPRILKLIGRFQGVHVAEERFDYWTPSDYWQTLLGLEWNHYLNEWHFEGSERLHYYLGAHVGLEDQGEFSLSGKAGLAWDSNERWTVRLEGSATQSDVYEERRGSLYLQYAW